VAGAETVRPPAARSFGHHPLVAFVNHTDWDGSTDAFSDWFCEPSQWLS
jgi:hypothetical protein